MPAIDVTWITYIVVIIFAIAGFSRGWWKEAITTVILAFLIFLLQTPGFAQSLIETFNTIVRTIWELVPQSFKDFLTSTFGIESARSLQADAGSTSTWLTFLILLILGVILLNRFFLPGGISRQGGYSYAVTPAGSILGALLGGLNGFIIANLAIEYLTGRNLPGTAPSTEIAVAGDGAAAFASSGAGLRPVNFLGFTILDSFVPWVIIGLGLLLLFAVLRSRVGLHSKNGFRRIDYRVPYGYEMVKYRRE